MERSLLKELTDTRLKAYLKANLFTERYWPSLFPLDYRDELTWETLQGEQGSQIVADVISYDSSAPEKGREVIGKASGKIAKVSVKRSMREEDFLMYKRLKKGAESDTEKNKILKMVFEDTDFVVNAVNARCEQMALQAASTGQLSLNKKNNNGVVTETAISFGIPTKNKTVVSNLVSDEKFDFIAEVKSIVKGARKISGKLNFMWMDADTFDAIAASKQLKIAYGFFMSKQNVEYKGSIFLEDLNNLLSKERLPQIILVESYMRFEDADHKRVELETWKPGYITFTIDKTFGRMQHGPIAEEDAESVKKYAIQSKKGHVLVTKWSEVDPLKEFTKGEASCFPVIDNPQDVYILNTNTTDSKKFI